MAKVITLDNGKGYKLNVIECPACGYNHGLDERWTFNNDYNNPTFTPSLLVHSNPHSSSPRCHSYITDGKIQYLSDCEHELAGQTVELPDIEG